MRDHVLLWISKSRRWAEKNELIVVCGKEFVTPGSSNEEKRWSGDNGRHRTKEHGKQFHVIELEILIFELVNMRD
jgi:hypothetical protein